MTTPMNPDSENYAGPSEYSYGKGLVGPRNVDYGENLPFPKLEENEGDAWENAVADRRTDSTDPDSGRDFTTFGNPDRYGAQPSLQQETIKREPATPIPTIQKGVVRRS